MRKAIEFIRLHQNENWFCLTVILLFSAVVVILPILFAGMPSGLDLLTDMRFAATYHEAFSNLTLIPSWANDNFGFGSVGVRFYPPLAFYTLAIVEMMTADWYTAISLNLFGWMFLGCTGVWLFAKEWVTPSQAVVAGMIYAIVPQHLMEIYQFFLYAEYAAWGVLPFCFLFVSRICHKQRWADAFLFGVAFSLLILTHIPTTIIASFSLPVFVLILTDWQQVRRTFLQLSLSLFMSLAATAYYWVKVATEFNWVAHIESKYSTGYYEFSSWLFPTILEHRSLFLLMMASWICDTAIVLTVLLLIPGMFYLLKFARTEIAIHRKIIMATTLTALFAFFMLSRLSEFIWQYVGILQKIQFPWRWLSVLSLLSIFSLTLTLPQLIQRFRRRMRLVVYPVLALIVAMIIFDVTEVIVPSGPYTKLEFFGIVEELQTKPIWEGWWPIWAKVEAFDNLEKASIGTRKVEIVQWERETRDLNIENGEPGNLRVATFYYPYWKASVNDQPVVVNKDEYGAILIPVSGETSKIYLYFEEPIANKIAKYISSTFWIFFLFLILGHARRTIIPKFNRSADTQSKIAAPYQFLRHGN